MESQALLTRRAELVTEKSSKKKSPRVVIGRALFWAPWRR